MYTHLVEEVLVCFTSGQHRVMLRGKVPCSRGLRKGNTPKGRSLLNVRNSTT
jgi:hypothetical protein